MKIIIYHNPKWGKSRNSVRILEEKNIVFTLVEYLKTPPTKQELKQIVEILNVEISEILRTSEKEFVENNLSEIIHDKDKIFDAIIKFPKILQRPIIICGDKGVIGRPPENIFKIL